MSTEDLYARFLRAGGKVCTDTRNIVPGSVFFALKGPSFNGNAFAQKAIDQGCSCAVVDEAHHAKGDNFIVVDDVLTALQDLARHHRRQFSIPVLAITGSNGKTTTKELVNAVLSQRYDTLYTEGNLNNHIGVPLTLLRLNAKHTFAIVEMGANHQQEIAGLCRIAEPGYGMITNIGKAHLEGFGGEEGVLKGKGELFDHLRANGGIAFVNTEDKKIATLTHGLKTFTYGSDAGCSIVGADTTTGSTVTFKYRDARSEAAFIREAVSTKITGRYNFINCLAAAAAGCYFGVDERSIRTALESYVPAMNRSQLVDTGKNLVLLDAYNANPDSMRAALRNFMQYEAKEKLALLGDMFELGDYSASEHEAVAAMAAGMPFETVVVGSEFSKHNAGLRAFATTAECMDYLKNTQPKGKTVLIKGSRGMKMETLKEAL